MNKTEPESPQPLAAKGPARIMSNQMGIYYSNCVMVATSPRDVSLFFGRFTPATDDKGTQTLAELYERQVYMTVEQAEDLVRLLTQTVQAIKARKQGTETAPQPSE